MAEMARSAINSCPEESLYVRHYIKQAAGAIHSLYILVQRPQRLPRFQHIVFGFQRLNTHYGAP